MNNLLTNHAHNVEANDSFRRQISSPGVPNANAPNVASCGLSEMGLVREALGLSSSLAGSSAGPLVFPVMMGLFGIVS